MSSLPIPIDVATPLRVHRFVMRRMIGEVMGMYDPPDVGFFVDDRGNVAQFYEFPAGDIVATLDREATVNGVRDQLAWDGSGSVEAWAIEQGYGGEIAKAARM